MAVYKLHFDQLQELKEETWIEEEPAAPKIISEYLEEELSKRAAAPVPSPTNFGFRRRCGWCGVQLRGWQRNLCHLCKRRVGSGGGPPCSSKSRWDAEPDTWRKKKKS